MEHVRWFSQLMWDTKHAGTALQVEKSRRLLISWLRSGCRLHSMGLRKETGVIAGETYAKSNEHVWRIEWLYRHLPSSWRLKAPYALGGVDGGYDQQQCRVLTLPNGSLAQSINQDQTQAQGRGKTWIDLEELSTYMRAAWVWGQAYVVTHGRSDKRGGHVVGISNTNGENAGWVDLVKPLRVIANNDPSWAGLEG